MARSTSTLIASMLLLGAAPGMAFVVTNSATAAPPVQSPQTTICHATGSGKFNSVKIDDSSVLSDKRYLEDHGDHADDIIPPITYEGVTFPGLNFTEAGQAILANGCKPVPTPSPSPTATETPDTTTPTPTVTETSTSTPTPTVTETSAPPAPVSVVVVPPAPATVVTETTPAPPVAPEEEVVPPLGATVPEDAFTEMEFAEEGAVEPLAATLPVAVNAGGGSSGENREGPLAAMALIMASALAAAGSVLRLARK
jgi:hypothetical protein